MPCLAAARQNWAELPPAIETLNASSKDANRYTAQLNTAVLSQLPFESKTDFEDASRDFIASIDGAITRGKDGVYSTQTLPLANHGYNMDETAERVKLPPGLAQWQAFQFESLWDTFPAPWDVNF